MRSAGATYLSGCTITRRSREAGGERRRDAERGGKWSFFLSLGPSGRPFNALFLVCGNSCVRSYGSRTVIWLPTEGETVDCSHSGPFRLYDFFVFVVSCLF